VLLDVARERPSALALDDGTRQRSFTELVDRARRFAAFLNRDAGLAPGEHLALLMGNRVEAVECLLGGMLAGLWVTPINWHLAEEEIAYVVADSGARIVVGDDRYEGIARRATTGLPGVAVLRAGDELDGLLAAARPAPVDLGAPAGGNMIYTSGTTGRPKGVKRARAASLGALLEGHARYGRTIGLDGSGPHLITGPMYHAAPLMFAVYDNANGAPILIMPRWDERAALELIVRRAVAHAHFVPTMFVRLLRLPDAERAAFDAPALTLALHGAAPISVAIKRRMIEWWGPKLVEYWGGTEGGVNTLIDSADWLAHPGSVGRALPGFEIFSVDAQGRRLPSGEVGDLYCRTDASPEPFAYHGDPAKTAASYLAPGVFTIGDVGSVDAEGYVALADRRSHMIISGGVNIYPAEIEQVIAEHPAVADVAVFGIPDEEWGESVKAAVELRPGARPDRSLEASILAHARAHLAGYKVPRSIDFEVELPRHPSGKLYVRKLRDPYWAGRDRKI